VFSTPRDPPVDPKTFFFSENAQNELHIIEFNASDIMTAIDELDPNAAPARTSFLQFC